jgi:hypothetical protein
MILIEGVRVMFISVRQGLFRDLEKRRRKKQPQVEAGVGIHRMGEREIYPKTITLRSYRQNSSNLRRNRE